MTGSALFNTFTTRSLPRPRGWTAGRHDLRALAPVSSARARVDPASGLGSRARRSLFRARAGGPNINEGNGSAVESLPRARGWTADADHDGRVCGVSSARARVDRSSSSGGPRRSRLFRARAGGPQNTQRGTFKTMSLPRARGWTDAVGGRRRVPYVSSARARVDRSSSSGGPRRSRLFRTRRGWNPFGIR